MADYVVTRKRKRYAVDPCLGYYMYAPSSDGGVESAGNLASEHIAHTNIDSRLELECTEPTPQLMKGSYKSGEKTRRENSILPSQDGRSNRAQLQEEDVLTVEAFLKSSAEERTTKTYRHRKLLKLRVNERKSKANTERATLSSRRDPTRRSATGDDGEDKNFGSHPRDDSKSTRRRQNRKPLKERLYEAAVLTHGNPDDYYTRSEAAESMASNRTALLFVPYEHASRDHAAGKSHKKALIVDPRKSMAMETASLAWRPLRGYTDSGLLSKTLDRIPLSKWNLTLNGGHDKSAGVPTNRKGSKTADMAIEYPPLKFVSFQEAEKNFKIMFPGAKNGLFLKPHTLTNIASPHNLTNKTAVHNCSRPSTAVSGILPGIPSVRTRLHLTTATSQQTSLASANAMSNVDIGRPLPGNPEPTVVLPHNSVSGESSASGLAKERLSLTLQISDIQNNVTTLSTLRPLGSLVNELLTVKRNSKV